MAALKALTCGNNLKEKRNLW